MSMKNSSDTIGNRTRELPTCSAVPQLTAPPRAPVLVRTKRNSINKLKNFRLHSKMQCEKTNNLITYWILIFLAVKSPEKAHTRKMWKFLSPRNCKTPLQTLLSCRVHLKNWWYFCNFVFGYSRKENSRNVSCQYMHMDICLLLILLLEHRNGF